MTNIDFAAMLDELNCCVDRIKRLELIEQLGSITYTTNEEKSFVLDNLLPELINQLRADEWEVSKAAIDSIGRLEQLAVSAVDKLIETIKWHTEMENQMSAAFALVAINGDITIRKLKEEIKQENESCLFYFAFALIKMEGIDSSGFDILKSLEDNRKLTRWQVERFNELSKDTLTKKLEPTEIYQVNNINETITTQEELLIQQNDLLNNILKTLKEEQKEIKNLSNAIENLHLDLGVQAELLGLPTIDAIQQPDYSYMRKKNRLKLDFKHLSSKFKEENVDKRQLASTCESFLHGFFNLIPSLRVSSVNTRNNEVDITISNQVDLPFWIQLQSPVIYSELKLKKSLRTTDIVSFLDRLENYYLTRIGLIFTNSKITKRLLSLSEEKDSKLVFIRFDDFNNFFEKPISALDFLEGKIRTQLKIRPFKQSKLL
ncbi:MAG: HEAT repeat domain-containing protein [Candidatus Heimdallarchaeota archaeon]